MVAEEADDLCWHLVVEVVVVVDFVVGDNNSNLLLACENSMFESGFESRGN